MVNNRRLKEKLILKKTVFICLLMCAFLLEVTAQNIALEQNFQNPPSSAKARTIWFWINGNVSKTGITADLEAMKKNGIQGAIIFNVSLGNPKGVVTYLSSDWLEFFKFAALEAKRLGLELGFHNGAGWSSTGGPAITPEYAMQELVFSETKHQGNKVFKGILPQPKTKLEYYKDIAILAFPKPKSDVRITDLDIKSLSHKVRNHLAPDDKSISNLAVVKKSEIIDLTSKLASDGSLTWKAPEGDWVILRLGHTPTAELNRFASDGGRGLECDKMSTAAVDLFWKESIMPILNKLDTLVGTVVNRCHIDSYEVGTTNWTTNFADEFKRLRAYDCLMYLPTLAGYYVESGEQSERFLWDFRRTIGDLIAEKYYARMAELSHKHGMLISTEPYWGPFDNMQVGESADLVMSEFWSGNLTFFDSPKFVASIAKLNGSNIAEAEAFTDTGGWQRHPGALKKMGDLAWAQGINRFVIHSYVHQPWNEAPGLTLQSFGIDFNRLNTWWEQGKPFLDYIARSQFLLQQGKSVADVLVFTGEASPNDALQLPEVKAMGYDYDLIGTNKLNSLTVKDGLICTTNGDKYQVLVLPTTTWMTPQTIIKMEALAKGGAIILGTKPKKSPSLHNYPKSDESVKLLAEELWNTGLIKDSSIVSFLQNGTLAPDFSSEEGNEGIAYFHRKMEDTDIYFVVNEQKDGNELKCRFRVSNKQPEFWNAETGEITKALVWQDNGDGTTSVTIPFASETAVFVIFKNGLDSVNHLLNASVEVQKKASLPLQNLKIIKAAYGVFLPDGVIDVTAVVKKSIQNNQLNVQATRDLCGGDPAPGYKKELRIQYKIGNTILEKNAMEREWLEIDAPESGKLEIVKAIFGKFERGIEGIPSNSSVNDITEKVKKIVASGVFEIQVNNDLLEENNVSTNKSLRVIYSTNDEEKSVTVANGDVLNLTQIAPKPKLISNKGKVNWVTPFSGEIKYQTSTGNSKKLTVKSVPKPIELTGEWQVSFPLKKGGILNKKLNQLVSFTTFSENDIRYFSGTASYKKQFNISAKLLKSSYTLLLDLGSVKEIAEVFINGKSLGILWKSPFRINIDEAVVKGVNTLEIKVTNLWPNRLIGDELLPLDYERKGPNVSDWPNWLINATQRPTERTTFAAFKHWHKDSNLLPSGLLGPVKIIVQKVKELKF